MIDFEIFFTSYSTFLFLALLKVLLLESHSRGFTIKELDALTEAYIDIIWHLKDQLQTQRRFEHFQPEIEDDMHRLCVHFFKTVMNNIYRTRPDVDVLYMKK